MKSAMTAVKQAQAITKMQLERERNNHKATRTAVERLLHAMDKYVNGRTAKQWQDLQEHAEACKILLQETE